MRKLQVLQLSCQPPYPPDEGGKIRTFQLLQGLRQIADITLVCFQRLPRETAAIEALRGLGYTVTPVPVPSYNPRWWHHLRSTDPLLVQRYGPKTLMDAARVHLARARYDVVVVDGPDACLASVGIERTNGVPLIYHAHNVETEVYRRCLAVGERSLKSRIAAGARPPQVRALRAEPCEPLPRHRHGVDQGRGDPSELGADRYGEVHPQRGGLRVPGPAGHPPRPRRHHLHRDPRLRPQPGRRRVLRGQDPPADSPSGPPRHAVRRRPPGGRSRTLRSGTRPV